MTLCLCVYDMGQNSYAANKSESDWGLRWWQERVSVKMSIWSLTGEVVREPVKEVWTESGQSHGWGSG